MSRLARRTATVLAAAALLGAIALGLRVAETYRTSDFQCFVTGARFVAEGRDPYDVQEWQAAMTGRYVDFAGRERAPFCDRYPYPLWTAVAVVPLAWMPAAVAAALWQAVLLAGTLAGVAFSWRAAGGPRRDLAVFALLVLGSQPFWLTIINAQFGGLLLGAAGALAYALRRRNDPLAGTALAALALKPHVLPLFGIAAATFLARARRIRALLVASAVLGVPFVVSVLIAPGWAPAWLERLFDAGRAEAGTGTSLWGLASLLGAPAVALPVAGLALAALALPAIRRTLTVTDALALSVVAWLLVIPYLGSHDQLVLGLPWAVVLAAGLNARGPRRVGLVVAAFACASLLPWALYAARSALLSGSEAANVLVVVATALLLGVTLLATRPPRPRAPAPLTG